jgi:hypothetical protein
MPRSSPRTFLPATIVVETKDDRARHTAVQRAAAKQGADVIQLYVPRSAVGGADCCCVA